MAMNQPVRPDNARKGAVRKRYPVETQDQASGDASPLILRQLAHLHASPS